jgi:O-antigen/teichoic acid export membrane protein
MIPVFLTLLLLAAPLVEIVYQGRYTEAIPMLQLFSLLSFAVPLTAVASSALLGLGQAKIGFVISIQSLLVSIGLYLVLIPRFDIMGATVGYVLSSFVLAWLNARHMNRFVPLTVRGVFARTHDIKHFVKARWGRA